MTWDLRHGDCLEVMRAMPDGSVDSIVTDPPYGMSKIPDIAEVMRHWIAGDRYKHASSGFMGKSWDSFVPGPEYWREAYRVLKPGGHLIAFASTRTFDLLSIAIRFANFEPRDMISYLYGSGFPKSLDISKAIDKATGAEREVAGKSSTLCPDFPGPCHGHPSANGSLGGGVMRHALPSLPSTDAAKQWAGWGTSLKPAHEPAVLARKPLISTVAANVLAHGVGGLNIDGCRIEHGDDVDLDAKHRQQTDNDWGGVARSLIGKEIQMYKPGGRWPANLLLDEEAAVALDEQSGERKSGGGDKHGRLPSSFNASTDWERFKGTSVGGDSGGASRFFFTAKASRSERELGCEHLPAKSAGEATDRKDGSDGLNSPRAGAGRTSKGVKNFHPTVKPVDLMRYLVRLITPKGGVVLDPFCGSGTTGIAALAEQCSFIGIERDAHFVSIARARIEGDAPLFNRTTFEATK